MNKLDILQPLKRSIALVLILGVFFNLSQLIYPVYMLQVYEKVLTSFSKDTLIYLVLLAVILAILGAITDGLRKSMLSAASLKIRNNHFSEILSRLAKNDRRNTEKTSYTRDLEQVVSYISGGTINTLLDIIWSPIFIIALFFMHPYLGAVGLFTISLIIIICLVSKHNTKPLNKKIDNLSNQFGQAERHYQQHYDALCGSALSENYNKKILEDQKQFYADKIQLTAINDRIHTLTTALKSTCQILILGTGAALVIDGILSPGLMIVGTILYGRAIQPFGNLTNIYSQSSKAIQAYKRLNGRLKQPTIDQSQSLHAENGQLRVQKLVVTLPNKETPIIKGISFDLNSGDALVLFGNARSGKSTLLRAIAGIWQPSNGSATLNNINTANWSRMDFAQSVGYLGQQVQLLPGTIKQNIAQFSNATDDSVIAAAKLAGVHHYILELPLGYESQISTYNIDLSSGTLQLIAIARALFGSPKLLLLDEPFSCLSFNMKHKLLESLEILHQKGLTIIVASSTNEAFAFANKSIVLNNGIIKSFNTRKASDVVAKSVQLSALELTS
jgi:PrtD family type I secretion system ABC transporter